MYECTNSQSSYLRLIRDLKSLKIYNIFASLKMKKIFLARII